MREYARVDPEFWIGNTGRKIRQLGRDAQVLAVYLISAPSAVAMGLYYLPLVVISHDTGISLKGASKALRRLSEAGFCSYDVDSEWVFVPNMARFQIGAKLEPGDKRVTWLKRELESRRKSPFFNDFLALYREPYHLQDLSPLEGPSKPVRRGDAPALPLDQSLILTPEKPSTDQPELLARLWNEAAPDLSPAQIPLGSEVRKHVQARLKKEPSLEKWRAIFERANQSAFLRGEIGKWHVTFSWAMENAGFAEKVLEGRWDESTKFSENHNGKADRPETTLEIASRRLKEVSNGHR